MRSVVYNLLSNALKYRHPDRTSHIDVRAHARWPHRARSVRQRPWSRPRPPAAPYLPTSPTCPALILLDINMPLTNGFEFLRAYAQRPERDNPTVVIIMLTTSLNPNDVAQMQNLPIAGYLTKPLTRDKVNQVLQQHFGHRATAT